MISKMFRLASAFAVQASAQYSNPPYQYGHGYGASGAGHAPTFPGYIAPPAYAEQLYTQPQIGLYGGVPHDVAPPVYVDVAFAQPIYGGTVQERVDIPHPDKVKEQQSSYLQQAQENLGKQKELQRLQIEEERAKITEDVRRHAEKAHKAAEVGYEQRLESLDRIFKEYEKRLEHQAKELIARYHRNQAQERFQAEEHKLLSIEQAARQRSQQSYALGVGGAQQQVIADELHQVHKLRQENMQRLQQDWQLIAEGGVPEPVVEEKAPEASEVPEKEVPVPQADPVAEWV